MYQSVSPNVNFVEQEKKIEAFWEEEHIFEKSIESRRKGTPAAAMPAASVIARYAVFASR